MAFLENTLNGKQHRSMENSTILNLTYTGVALLILGLMYLLSPGCNYKPAGVFLASTQRTYAPTTLVKVFDEKPSNYKKIGIINMTLHSDANSATKAREKQLVDATLSNIAQHGASGLIIKQMYFLPKDRYGALMAGYHLLGIAIRTEGN